MVFESNQSQFCLNCVTFRWKEHLHEILNRTSFQFRLICLTWTLLPLLLFYVRFHKLVHLQLIWHSLPEFHFFFHKNSMSVLFQINFKWIHKCIIWGTLKMFLWYQCFIISSWQNHFEKDISCIRSRSKYQILVHLCT